MKVSYSWLREYIGDTKHSAADIADLLTFHAFEIESVEDAGEDTVLDVDVLPNRSSDCLCHRGIAREIASITGTPLQHDPLSRETTLPTTDHITIEIEDPEDCPRFTASVIEGVEIKESPAWLQERLRVIGARPINNIVDATNYVMYAIGQPIHAYDADRFPQKNGTWRFGVRRACEGEVVALIAEGGKDEERDVELSGGELLIVDASTDTPIGLAGVKGGRFAGIHEETTNVLIEAAHFNPILTRRTARAHGIQIDASKRFENEPSRGLPPYGQQEVVELITKIAGGECKGMVGVYLKHSEWVSVDISAARVNALLGLSLKVSEMKDILRRIGAQVLDEGNEDAENFTVIGPWERTDLTIEEDFIEEIGRIHGYADITSVMPEPAQLMEVNARHHYSEHIRDILTEQGFSEVITSSFRKKDKIKLANALANDKGCLRSSLQRNIVEVLEKNITFIDLLGIPDVRVFEIGTVFENGKSGVSEHVSLALGVRTKRSYSPKDDPILLDGVAAIEKALGVALAGNAKDGVYECDLSAIIETLPEPTEYRPVMVSSEIQYRPFSQFPHVSRDIALWVPAGTTAMEIEAVLNEHTGPLCVRTTLFDEFSKDNRISYAFRLVFQSHEKTLTDAEVNAIMDNVYKAVSKKGWEVR